MSVVKLLAISILPVSYTHLMDVQMPVMNGYEATRQIRALTDPALSGITIPVSYTHLGMTGFVLNNVKRRYFVMNVKIPNG